MTSLLITTGNYKCSLGRFLKPSEPSNKQEKTQNQSQTNSFESLILPLKIYFSYSQVSQLPTSSLTSVEASSTINIP